MKLPSKTKSLLIVFPLLVVAALAAWALRRVPQEPVGPSDAENVAKLRTALDCARPDLNQVNGAHLKYFSDVLGAYECGRRFPASGDAYVEALEIYCLKLCGSRRLMTVGEKSRKVREVLPDILPDGNWDSFQTGNLYCFQSNGERTAPQEFVVVGDGELPPVYENDDMPKGTGLTPKAVWQLDLDTRRLAVRAPAEYRCFREEHPPE